MATTKCHSIRPAARPLAVASPGPSKADTGRDSEIPASGSNTPTFQSPVKSKSHTEESEDVLDGMLTEVSTDNECASTASMPDPIIVFPMSGQPVSDTMMKDMPLSLRESLQKDMMACIQQTKFEIQELGERVDHVDRSMCDFADNYNTLVDTHTAQAEDISWIKEELADLEDRSRRNNLKIRGITQSVQASQAFLFTSVDLTIDRIHHVPKPSFLPRVVPGDEILIIHFLQVKEQL